MMKPTRAQAGLSIIEITVALALSLIITLGLVQIFTANSQTFRVSEASSRVQESGRFATGIVARAVRNADYFGCLRDLTKLNTILNNTAGFDVALLLRGLDAENNINDGTAVAGTDRLLLGGVNGNSDINVTFQPSQPAANLQVNDNSAFNINDILIVTNCKGGDIFQVTNVNSSNDVVVHNSGSVSAGPGNSTQSLSTNYNDDPEGASIFLPQLERYYLRQNASGGRDLVLDGVGVTGASVGVLTNPVALISNVWDFQVQLGVDTTGNGQVDAWQDPQGLTVAGQLQADSAIAVRVSLLVRSPDNNVTDGGQVYCFPGWLDCEGDNTLRTTANANDTFLYRVYTATTALRNRT